MPELPEVETVRRSLKKKVLNKTFDSLLVYHDNILGNASAKDLEKEIKNKSILDILRRGKWLIFDLGEDLILSHLRMEGKYFLKDQKAKREKHEHVIFRFTDGTDLRYHDVRKFGKILLIKKKDLDTTDAIAKLGLEPWSLNPAYLKEKFSKKNLPIKAVLLDQSIISGIGNIYADEILFASKINPHKKAKLLNETEIKKLIESSKLIIDKAIEKGGTTIRSYISEEGISGRFQNDLMVHLRKDEACFKCGTKILKDRIAGRSSYYCPKCQEQNKWMVS